MPAPPIGAGHGWDEYDFTTISALPNCANGGDVVFDPRSGGLSVDSKSPFQTMYNTESAMFGTDSFPFEQFDEMDSSGHSTRSLSTSASRSIPSETPSGQSLLSTPSGKCCPFLAGLSTECSPVLCGPDAPCLEVPVVPEIEECDSVPCITQPADVAMTNPLKRSSTDSIGRFSSQADCSNPNPSRPPKNSRKSTTRQNRRSMPSKEAPEVDKKTLSKKAHSIVERRYRENLNSRIAQLYMALQKTRRVDRTTGNQIVQDDEDDELTEQTVLAKVRKSDVLLNAMEYVHQTEVEMRHMANEIQQLRDRTRQLEKLVKCEDCILVKQLVNLNC